MGRRGRRICRSPRPNCRHRACSPRFPVVDRLEPHGSEQRRSERTNSTAASSLSRTSSIAKSTCTIEQASGSRNRCTVGETHQRTTLGLRGRRNNHIALLLDVDTSSQLAIDRRRRQCELERGWRCRLTSSSIHRFQCSPKCRHSAPQRRPKKVLIGARSVLVEHLPAAT